MASNSDNIVEITTRATTILVDVVILVVTWWKTYTTARMAREAKIETPLSQLLLRDGTVYFLGLLIGNVITLTIYLAKYNNGFQLAIGIYCMESIIISRFLLNLREVGSNQHDASRLSTSGSRLSVGLHFAVVGNMGEELHGSFGIGAYPSDLEGEDDDRIGGVEGGNENAGDVPPPTTEDAEIMEVSRV